MSRTLNGIPTTAGIWFQPTLDEDLGPGRDQRHILVLKPFAVNGKCPKVE
jgi:hypothetical protein